MNLDKFKFRHASSDAGCYALSDDGSSKDDVRNGNADTFRMALVHELRAPLQVLQGHLDALWDDAGPMDDGLGDARSRAPEHARAPRKRLGSMRSMLDALAGAVDDVLELGRGEVAQLPLREARFEVRSCLDTEVDAFFGKANAKGLDLTCEIAHDVPVFLWGDATRLRQILRTLLDNALKYTMCGGVVVRVAWAAQSRGEPGVELAPFAGCLTIHVSDTGPGIPAGMENAVFAAFARADPSVQGTGLGLWIAQQWAQRLAGSLSAESSSSGARFRLSVPFRLPGHIAGTTTPVGGSGGTASGTGTAAGLAERPEMSEMSGMPAMPAAQVALREGLQALVVDDHVMNRRILGEQLTSLGCHVAGAGDLTDALLQWIALDVDVVLTDVHLDGVSGLALARTLHALAPVLGRRKPVVYAVTGSVVGARAAREAGIDEVLTKPVSRERLSRTLAVRWPALGEPFDTHGQAAEVPGGSETPGRPPSPRLAPLRSDPYARRIMRDEMAKDLARFRRLMVRRRAEDIDAAHALLHRMRGACRMFGDPELTARCDRLADRLATRRDATGDDL
ncbi:hypothetical protein DBA20_25900 [Pandoraea capi]|nr:hypothetical protein [Pandoraea sp. LA3]MDN4586423.1 hypothetical protein [Pandoraea capi]